jgi:hypothetical protein
MTGNDREAIVRVIKVMENKIITDLQGLLGPPAAQRQPLTDDTRRLEWLMYCISGREFRRIGVEFEDNVSRIDIDRAIEAAVLQRLALADEQKDTQW